ncbi:hypothetical protein [Amycolatopsis sp. NBC_00438]|uniref:hypothetical protein n=1 Tax=Amycolatopsis sp. NBC_00438 TaxID=2903558 RepID=UPI002E245790
MHHAVRGRDPAVADQPRAAVDHARRVDRRDAVEDPGPTRRFRARPPVPGHAPLVLPR